MRHRGLCHLLWLSLLLIPQVANAQGSVCHLSRVSAQHVCNAKSSICQVCLSPHGSASEGKAEGQTCAPDLPQSKPLADMKWRCGFQPVPGSFGRADVPGRRGTPTQQQKPWQGSSSLWQTWTQGRGPSCSITSPNQGVLPRQWFVCTKGNCWQFLETLKTSNLFIYFHFSLLRYLWLDCACWGRGILRERHTQTYCSKTILKHFSSSFPLRYGTSATTERVRGEWFDWQTISKPRITQSWLVPLHAPQVTLESHPVSPATLS